MVKRHHIVNLTTGWRRLVPGRMQGSSIIEALVSMIIVAIVFAGAVTAFTDAFRSDRTTIRLGAFEAAMQTMDSIAEYDCRPEWVDHTGYSVGISYDSSSIPGIVLVEVEALGADQAKLFSMKRYMSGK